VQYFGVTAEKTAQRKIGCDMLQDNTLKVLFLCMNDAGMTEKSSGMCSIGKTVE